jgi:hypothetical protein
MKFKEEKFLYMVRYSLNWIILPLGYLLARRPNWLRCWRDCCDVTPRIGWNSTIFSIILSYANRRHHPPLRRCPSQIWLAFQHLQRRRRSQCLLGPCRRLQPLKTTTQRLPKRPTISCWYRAQASCVASLGVRSLAVSTRMKAIHNHYLFHLKEMPLSRLV